VPHHEAGEGGGGDDSGLDAPLRAETSLPHHTKNLASLFMDLVLDDALRTKLKVRGIIDATNMILRRVENRDLVRTGCAKSSSCGDHGKESISNVFVWFT